MKVRKILCQDPVEDQEEEASAVDIITITIITDLISEVGAGAHADVTITAEVAALADFSVSL